MKTIPKNTVRFDALVKASGPPEQMTLWRPPQEDAGFMKAISEERVVTVAQRNVGTAKDYGVIGFHKLENTTFLVFPKALPYASGTKVVGIKYEKLAAVKAADAVRLGRTRAAKARLDVGAEKIAKKIGKQVKS